MTFFANTPQAALRGRRAAVAFAFTSIGLGLVACNSNKPVDDATLTQNVQTALKNDQAVSQQPIQVAAQNGTVTLTGNVADQTSSTVAAQDAARVAGVKQVIDSLTVAGAQVAPTVTSPAAPTQPRMATPQERQAIATGRPLPAPPVAAAPMPAAQPAPLPPPQLVQLTIPAGTSIPIRITESLSSDHTQTGEPFNGVVTRDIVRRGLVAVPSGSPVSGRVVDAKDATHFKGSSQLSVQLTAIRRRGDLIAISTDPYTLTGKARGKNSAVKIGGGAAGGALLGGLLGGGKGAGIGALAGGGAGTVFQGVTRGQQVSIPSESTISFRLASPFTVSVTERAANAPPSPNAAPTLQQR